MRTFWGLMRAYWFSERWKQAWGLTLMVTLLTALASKASVWMAEASGDLINAIASYHDPDNTAPFAYLLTSVGTLLLLVVIKDAGFIGVRHLFSTTLHRKWRAWLDTRFNEALLDANHTHLHIQQDGGGPDGLPTPAPDNVDQRVQDAIKGLTGGAIGLAMGVIGVVTALYFVGQKLLETSTMVDGLEFLGVYGSAVLAFAAVAAYVPLNTFIAVKLGGMLERLNIRMQKAEGSYRGELTTLLRRSFHVAASRGEKVQKSMHGQLYEDIDDTWSRLNRIDAGYMSFRLIYDFVAARIVAYGPGLVSYMNDRISLKGYVTGAELVNSLIQHCSWFIHVMPAIATLRANSSRVTELAEAIEQVQRPRDFYSRTGRSDFSYTPQQAWSGLTIRGLELMHRGTDTTPFLTAGTLHFAPGEWTFLKGDSGSGKTSLMKAMNGLWPYGRGDFLVPGGVGRVYAAQEVKLPPVSLKQLACLPDSAGDHPDAQVASALHKAGLGEFIEFLADDAKEGTSWDQLLSGGQKQKLVLARIILHKPGLLFLDEATGALDPESRIAFHQAIRDNCPDATVISVMHEAVPPKSANGDEFYDSVLSISDGVAFKRPLLSDLPVEITALLTRMPSPGELRGRGRPGPVRERTGR